MSQITQVCEESVLSEIAAGLGLSLSQAARLLPSCRAGRPVHASCLWRWIVRGVQLSTGETVRLEAARLAGRYLTTAPAIERFLRRQTPASVAPSPAPRTPGKRRRAVERASRELERIGI